VNLLRSLSASQAHPSSKWREIHEVSRSGPQTCEIASIVEHWHKRIRKNCSSSRFFHQYLVIGGKEGDKRAINAKSA